MIQQLTNTILVEVFSCFPNKSLTDGVTSEAGPSSKTMVQIGVEWDFWYSEPSENIHIGMKSGDLNFVAQTEKQLWGLEHSKLIWGKWYKSPNVLNRCMSFFTVCISQTHLSCLCFALWPSFTAKYWGRVDIKQIYPTRWHIKLSYLPV